jgi:hypothetical protein
MSKFLKEQSADASVSETGFGGFDEPQASRFRKVFGKVAIVALAIALIAGIGGYAYWRSLRDTPQYSLALLVDAARRDDQATIDHLIDVNSVVDDFVPQITSKAVELYGRGLSQGEIQGIGRIANPILPAVKNRVRSELPRQIRNKTEKFESVPFVAMVLGANRYLDIEVRGDSATVKSKLPEHSFEVTMRRSGDEWKITGLRDDQLSTDIARNIGEEIIAVASSNRPDSPNKLGIRNLTDLLQQAEEILK